MRAINAVKRNGREGWMVRDSQGNLCCPYALIRMKFSSLSQIPPLNLVRFVISPFLGVMIISGQLILTGPNSQRLSLLLILDIFKIIIIIIMSRWQHGSPWPSLAIRLYHPSLLVGLQSDVLYRHIAVIYRFQLVVLSLLIMWRGP